MISINTGDGRTESIRIIDVDVHVHENPKEMAPYCDMPWRKSLEMMEEEPGRYIDIPGFAPSLRLDPPFPGGATARKIFTAAQMREDLDSMGIDIGVLFPDHLLTLALLPNRDYAAAVARAYNAWLIDRWLRDNNGLRGALVAAPQDPVDAARQIERYAREPNIIGVYLPTAAVRPLYGDTWYDPLYQAAQSAGLPVLLHSVSVVHPNFPFNLQDFDTALARHTLAHPFSMIANMVSMITTGVPARFPNLKIAFCEAGISWVPFVMWRLDKEYTEQRRQIPFLEDKPSTYIRRFYYCTQPVEEPDDTHDFVSMLHLFGGEDSVMYASDWPHHDFDHPNKVLQLPLSLEAKRKLMGGNAAKLFNLQD
ncbi:MAG: amidohydrolase [Chloroflexi bacterium]|nr:amidohydrolase [Chloroflexota bacterium]